uniref:Uncharacterized protein n=1 Tax=Anguilla anguilla TaxID=7936 RepID=A0A0E9S720_ANGAN
MKVLEQKAMTTDDQSGKSTTDEENRMLTNEGSESAEVNGREAVMLKLLDSSGAQGGESFLPARTDGRRGCLTASQHV